MIAARENNFDFQGVRYRYLTWGEPDRASVPVILLHGFSQSADSWDHVASLLADQHQVYALDLVGHGGSTVPQNPSPYALLAQGEALLAFVEQVAAQSADVLPVLVGYSMGGRVALSSLVNYPEAFAHAVSSLVLESAGLGPASDAERARAAERDAACAARLREEGLEAFMDTWEQLPLFATQRTLPPSVRAHVRAGRLANDAEALARTFEHAGQHSMPSQAATLAALKCVDERGMSLCYVAGALDQKYRTLSDQVAAIPGASVEVIEGAGHNVHLEAPTLFVCAFKRFLASAHCGYHA